MGPHRKSPLESPWRRFGIPTIVGRHMVPSGEKGASYVKPIGMFTLVFGLLISWILGSTTGTAASDIFQPIFGGPSCLVCIERGDQATLAFWRATCDTAANDNSFPHGVLRPVTPEDIIPPLSFGLPCGGDIPICPDGSRLFCCVAVHDHAPERH